jgi:glycosyltransferase involved in cell wall biosynthesis
MHLDNGIPHHHFGPKRPLPETARRFASLGSIVPHKGVHVLIDAFASLPDDARLTIWGDLEADPTYVRHLRSRVRHPGINFAGCLEPEHVPGRLREADCLVVPSIWAENSPLVIQEAFAAGIPVLASGLGGIPEQLRAGGGLLVQANEPLELGRALQRLYTERGLARALVEKAPPAKRMGEHAEELTTRYETLVDKARKRGRVKRAEFAGEVL